MSWLSGWTYRKPYVINQTAGAGEGYQIPINVYYTDSEDSGNNVYLDSKCKADFGDIRFTGSDGSSELDYWREEKTDSTSARFWVEVSGNLNSSDVTIYLYYGNESATYTDVYTDLEHGERTFLFFDNFNDASINSSKWDVVGSCSESGGSITVGSSSNDWNYIRSDDTFSRPCKILARLNIDNRSTSMSHNGLVFATNDGGASPWVNGDDLNFHGLSWQNVSPVKVTCAVAGSFTSWDSDTYFGAFNVFGVYWDVDETDFTLGSDIQANIGSSYANPVYLFISDYDANKYTRCDWIFVAKYVDSEPTGSWGAQQEQDSEPMFPLIEADFETGDVSEFDGTSVVNGLVTTSGFVTHHSSYSCKCSVDNDGNAYAEGYFDIDPDLEVVYCRAYFRFNQLPEINKDYTIISFQDTTGPTTIGYIQLIDDGGTKKWKMMYSPVSGTAYTTSQLCIPTVGLWVCVEFAHGDGVAKLWVDGKEILSSTNADDKAIDRVHVGICSSDIDADDTLEIYVDRVVVTNSYVGPHTEVNNLLKINTKMPLLTVNLETNEVYDMMFEEPQYFNDPHANEGVTGILTFQDIGETNHFTSLFAVTFGGDVNPSPALCTSHHLLVRKDFQVRGMIESYEGVVKLHGGSKTWAPSENPFIFLADGGAYGDKNTLEIRIVTDIGANDWDFGGLTCGNLTAAQLKVDEIKTAEGDPYVWDLVNMPKGPDGYVLTAQDGSTPPVWAPVGGGSHTHDASDIVSGAFGTDRVTFCNQYLNTNNDAIFNSVLGTSTTAGLKAGSGENMVAISHNGSHGYVTALSGSLIIGSSTGSVSFNMSTTVYPYGPNQGNIGTEAYYWGSGWFNYLRYKDLNSFDALDDLTLAKNYKTKRIEQNGIETEVINHESLPFLKAEKTGENAEDFFDAGKVNGFLLGCVKRLAEEVDLLKSQVAKNENP